MPGVAFVAHCLLNQNSKTDGGARCPGIYSPLVEVLRERGWQHRADALPRARLHRAAPLLGGEGAARHDRLPAPLPAASRGVVAGAIEVHVARGDEVILVGLEGSPSMGVHVTSSDPDRGGRPEWPDGAPELVARAAASSSRS